MRRWVPHVLGLLAVVAVLAVANTYVFNRQGRHAAQGVRDSVAGAGVVVPIVPADTVLGRGARGLTQFRDLSTARLQAQWAEAYRDRVLREGAWGLPDTVLLLVGDSTFLLHCWPTAPERAVCEPR